MLNMNIAGQNTIFLQQLIALINTDPDAARDLFQGLFRQLSHDQLIKLMNIPSEEGFCLFQFCFPMLSAELLVDVLYKAAVSGNLLVVQACLHSVPVDAIGSSGLTALIGCTECRSPAIANMLIAAGANVNFAPTGVTPVDFAVEKDNFEVVKVLVEAGAAIDYDNPTVQKGFATQLYEAAEFGKLQTVMDCINKHHVPVDVLAPNTALSAACGLGHEDIVAFLISVGANVNYAPTGVTPLLFAARASSSARAGNYSRIIERLLLAGAEDLRCIHGLTALEAAKQEDNFFVASTLTTPLELLFAGLSLGQETENESGQVDMVNASTSWTPSAASAAITKRQLDDEVDDEFEAKVYDSDERKVPGKRGRS